MNKSNVVAIKPKELSPQQACVKFREEGYSEEKHQYLVQRSYEQFLSVGLRPILLKPGVKFPKEDDWNTLPIHPKEDFLGYSNIGLQTGEAGGFIADIDNDDPYITEEMMDWFLPPTAYKFGRYYGGDTQKLNHRLYRYTDREETKYPKISNPTKSGAIELRMDRIQTMAPTSTIVDHKRGYIIDSVRWAGGKSDLPSGAIGETTAAYIDKCRRVMYASVYAAEYFKPNYFHDHMMYWCGFMVSAGVDDALLEKSISWIVKVSGQTDISDRMSSVRTTRAKVDKDGTGSAAGISFLRDSENWDNKFCSWLAQLMKTDLDHKDDSRPSVHIVSSRETHWQDLTLEAMIAAEKFYQMSGQACVVTKQDNKAHIVPLDKGVNAASWLTREIRFTQSVMDKASGVVTEHVIKCPTSLAIEIADASTYKGDLPVVMGVSNTPIITPDGRVIETHWGYDKELKTFFSCDFSVQPMYRDEALPILQDVLCDFPFVSERYKAAALSAILTAVIRPALDICPMYLITSSQYSDGKSVLSGLIAASVGVEASLGQLTRGGSDEEQEKQLSAILSRGRRVVTLDNHDGEFRSAALTEALTSMNPEFRVLGKNETRSVANKTMFLLNGVNTSLSLDLQTRAVTIRLAQRHADISDRKFKYADVVGYTHNNRGKLVSASIALMKWAFEQSDGAWKANHRFKTWDYMVRRTIQLVLGVDIAPPATEDSDRSLDSVEESRYGFLELVLKTWKDGVRSADSKTGNFFRSSDLAHRIAPDSEQEAWVNILSKRPKHDIIFRCGFSLNNVKEYPFKGDDDKTWRLESYTVKGKSAYRLECLVAGGVV